MERQLSVLRLILLLMLMLAASLFLSGCDESAETPLGEDVIYYDAYEIKPLDLPEDRYFQADQIHTAEQQIWIDLTPAKHSNYSAGQAVYDFDGSRRKVYDESSSDLGDGYFLRQRAFCSDGSYVTTIVQESDLDHLQIRLYDAEDQLLKILQTEIEQTGILYPHYMENGEIWFNAPEPLDNDGLYNTLCLNTETEAITYRDVPFTTGDFLTFPNGDIYIPNPFFTDIPMLYHPDTGVSDAYIGYRQSEESLQSIAVLYDNENAYLVSQNGIFRQSPDGTEIKILDWDHSDLSFLQFDFVRMLDESRILVLYEDRFRKETYPAILVPLAEKHIPAKNQITMASIGMSQETRALVKESVYAFNRFSDHYHISLTDYDTLTYDHIDASEPHDMNGRKIPDPSFSAFEDDILKNNKRFDIYLFGEHETVSTYNPLSGLTDKKNYRTMMEKLHLFGSLPDISSYPILPNIRNVFSENDTVTAIPLSFHFSTLVTLSDILPDNTPFSMDNLYSLAESCDQDHVLFSSWVSDDLNAVMQYRMIDRAEGTAHFDSPEYIRYLSFYPEIERKYVTDRREYHLIGSHNNGPRFDGTIPSEALKNREYAFLRMDIVNGQDFWSLNYIFRDAPVNFCGFPSSGGSAHLFYSDMTLCSGEAANQNGVKTFLDFMLSDDVQCSEGFSSSSLPVTENGLSSLFSGGWGYYIPWPEPDSFRVDCIAATKDRNTALALSYDEVEISEDFAKKLYQTLKNGILCPPENETISDIITEEYAAITGGVRSCEEAASMIQNRVQLYLSE